jgi:hypothetical protein
VVRNLLYALVATAVRQPLGASGNISHLDFAEISAAVLLNDAIVGDLTGLRSEASPLQVSERVPHFDTGTAACNIESQIQNGEVTLKISNYL